MNTINLNQETAILLLKAAGWTVLETELVEIKPAVLKNPTPEEIAKYIIKKTEYTACEKKNGIYVDLATALNKLASNS